MEIKNIPRSLLGAPRSDGFNPTLILFLVSIATLLASTSAYLFGSVSLLFAGFINGACLYVLYTVNHEAVHQLAHQNRLVNDWMGRISAAFEGITFPLFRIIHLQHHAHTNHDERDPDFVIGRRPRWLLPLWTLVRLTHDNLFVVRRHLWVGRAAQLAEHLATVSLQIALVATAGLSGHLLDVVFLWLIPCAVSGALIELTVAWLVHFPHESRHPLESTRMFRGALWQVVTLNQSYHLVHHLWPTIPWFRYRAAAPIAEAAVQAHTTTTYASKDCPNTEK